MPYIPIEHEKYDILPYCRRNGGEVFSYDVEMENEIGAMLPDGASVIPYGYDSYEEFDDCLDEYILMLGISDGELNSLGQKILEYKADIKRRNVKEDWSVVKYVGETTGLFGLTHGRCYYWPCSSGKPEYEGVIDDEEFTSYLMCDMNSDVVYQSLDEASEKASFHEYHKPCSNWEIVEDPTGMALRILEGTGSITKKTIKIRMSPVHAERKKADRFPGVGWNCDNCVDYLCDQPGFDDHNDLWACLKCGYDNHISRLEILYLKKRIRSTEIGNWDILEKRKQTMLRVDSPQISNNSMEKLYRSSATSEKCLRARLLRSKHMFFIRIMMPKKTLWLFMMNYGEHTLDFAIVK